MILPRSWAHAWLGFRTRPRGCLGGSSGASALAAACTVMVFAGAAVAEEPLRAGAMLAPAPAAPALVAAGKPMSIMVIAPVAPSAGGAAGRPAATPVAEAEAPRLAVARRAQGRVAPMRPGAFAIPIAPR
ncbi:MAG: hypothetical protein AAFS07_14570 [Pseudomonadota bacterium]